MTTLTDLIEVALRFVNDQLPGCIAEDLEIKLLGDDKPFHVNLRLIKQVAVPPAASVSVPAAALLSEPAEAGAPLALHVEKERSSNRHPMIHPCIKEILATLREINRPLTKLKLIEEMWKRDYDWSESSVTHYLAVMMEDGIIENPKGSRPPGYRLTE